MASIGDVQSLAALAEYHNDVINSLDSFLAARFDNGDTRFLNYTAADFQLLLDSRRLETELRSSLALLTMIEAGLRIDFRLRVKQRKKDSLSKAFRSLKQRAGKRIRFDDLLDLWGRHHPAARRRLMELRSALHFRHWLAHGRYWEQPGHGNFDYFSIYDLADAILANFPLVRES